MHYESPDQQHVQSGLLNNCEHHVASTNTAYKQKPSVGGARYEHVDAANVKTVSSVDCVEEAAYVVFTQNGPVNAYT